MYQPPTKPHMCIQMKKIALDHHIGGLGILEGAFVVILIWETLPVLVPVK